MIKIGFGESYSKVIIYNKIDGSKIKDFDEDLFTQTFGIVGEVELNKLRFHISQCQKEHIESQTIFGWGSNGFGQLGLSNIAVGNNIPQPKELPIPEELVAMDD